MTNGQVEGRSCVCHDPKSQMHFFKFQVLLPYGIDEIINWNSDIFIIPLYTIYLSPHWLVLPQITTSVMHIFLTSPAFKNYNFIECPNRETLCHLTLEFKTFTRFSLQCFSRNCKGILACSTRKSWFWTVTFCTSISLYCRSSLVLMLVSLVCYCSSFIAFHIHGHMTRFFFLKAEL